MPDFEFRAIGRDGVEIRGLEQAESLEQLTSSLRKRQLSLLGATGRKTRQIGLAVVLPFVSELSPLVNSGIPLERSLQFIAEDSREARVADLADRLRKVLKRGESLSAALEQVGRFDSLLLALVKVGEASGELGKVLAILETYYQEARQVARDLVGALTYPAILAAVSLLSVIGLAWFVVPVFKDLFDEEASAALPLTTRLVFALSEFTVEYGLMVALGLLACGAAVALLVRRNDAANRAWHGLQLRVPLLGELWAQFAAFRLAKALSIMLGGGLPLMQAVELARPLLTNRLQSEGLDDCLAGLRKGEPVPRAIDRIPALPVQFHRFVKLGNETGSLGVSLGRVADMLQADFRNRLRTLIAILDPLLILSMGSVIGFMVISILLAVLSLSDVR
jgi:general secretion pathway protein F